MGSDNNVKNKPNKPIPKENGKIREKVFSNRKSLLTELSDKADMRTVYSVFLMIWINLALQILAMDYTKTGKFNLTISLMGQSFKNFDKAMAIWFLIFGTYLLLYPAFVIWAKVRSSQKPKSVQLYIWDRICLLVYISYQTFVFWIVLHLFLQCEFYVSCGIFVLFEQIRCFMKGHAFVRSNAPRVLSYKPHTENSILYPTFGKFWYFSFAPTLVYRDEYPRLAKRRWTKVLWYIFEGMMTLAFVAFLSETFFWTPFKDFGHENFDRSTLLVNFFKGLLPGLLIFMSAFYFLLHAWSNAWAELLRFADRRFYEDWWNSTAYSDYYRTWNIVVHDWLHTYIYKDVYEILVPGNKNVATLMTFFVSALVHEYILAFCMKFFYPVMLVFFGGVGVLLVFVMGRSKSALGNTFFWFSISTGNGILISSYVIEYAARIHCPRENETFADLFIPRSWFC